MRFHRPVAAAVAAAALTAACTSSGGAGGASSANPGGSGTTVAAKVTLTSITSKVDLSQCSKDSRSIRDDNGTSTITGSPTRVVVLETSFADALANVAISPIGIADDGDTSKITGLHDHFDKYTSVGLRSAPNLGVISSLKPDLIIADTTRDKAIEGQLKGIAPTISLTSVGAGYIDTLVADLKIAVAMNKCDAMEQALKSHLQRMDAIAANAHYNGQTFIYADVSPPDFNAHGANQWEPEILSQIGMTSSVAAKPGTKSQTLSLEQVYSDNPDVMFLGADGPNGNSTDAWKDNDIWKQITAVKNNKVYVVDGTAWGVERGIKTSELLLQQAISDLAGS